MAKALKKMHKHGFSHGFVQPQHIYATQAGHFKLAGLENCYAMGVVPRDADEREWHQFFIPPEARKDIAQGKC